LSHDILALAGPALAKRQVLFDFIEELAKRLGECSDVACQPLCLGLGLAPKFFGQAAVWTKLARAADLGLQFLAP
jgi:hypothetical protein